MTEETLKKGIALSQQIYEMEQILSKIIKYESNESTGQFVLDDYYHINIPEETAKKAAMLIKIEISTQLQQLKKEFEQLGKE